MAAIAEEASKRGTKRALKGNPRDDCSFISRWTYAYVDPLLDIGQKRALQQEDLYALAEHDRVERIVDILTRAWAAERERVAASSKQPAYSRAMLSAYKAEIWLTGLLTLAESITKISQPVMLRYLVAWLSGEGNQSAYFGWTIAAGMGAVALLQTFIHHVLFYCSMRLGWNYKIGTTGMIHAKVLQLGAGALLQTTQGQVINIVSNDVQRFMELGVMGHFSWCGLFDVAAILVLVALQVGIVAALAGVATTVCLIPVQLQLGRKFARNRAITARFTDERVRVMGEVLSGIASVKAFNWQKPFSALNTAVREKECGVIRKSQIMKAFNIAVSFASPVTASLTTFIVYWAQGNRLEPAKVFASLGLLHILRMSLGMWSRAIEIVAESRVSTRRISNFLLLPEAPKRNWGTSAGTAEQFTAGSSAATAGASHGANGATTAGASHVVAGASLGSGDSGVNGTTEASTAQQDACTQQQQQDSETLLSIEDGAFSWHALSETYGKNALSDQAKQDAATDATATAATADGAGEQQQQQQPQQQQQQPTVSNINFAARRGKLVILVGPVGSGRTTLLEAILGEVPLVNGSLYLRASQRVAYASQKPFIRACSLRENVTFAVAHLQEHSSSSSSSSDKEIAVLNGQPQQQQQQQQGNGVNSSSGSSHYADSERYDRVKFAATLAACDLNADVRRLPDGVETEIGERGVNLSGGQKARLSLARAVYSDADLYLLDDPLSAVDPKVAVHLFETCILESLVHRGKAVVLATHQLQCLPQADLVVVLDADGVQVAAGPLAELEKMGLDIAKYAAPRTAAVMDDDDDVDGGSTSDSSTDIDEDETRATSPATSAIDETVLLNAPGVPLPDANALNSATVTVSSATAASTAASTAAAANTSVDSARRSQRARSRSKSKSSVTAVAAAGFKTVSVTEKEDRELGSVGGRTYVSFAQHGGWLRCCSAAALMCVAQTSFVLSDWWLKYWSGREDQSSAWLGWVFAALVVTTGILGLVRSALFFNATLSASMNVHKKMHTTVLQAPMSFFNSNPQGRILNRFSNDQGCVDELLPVTAHNAIEIILFAVAAVILVCVTLPYVALAVLPMVVLFWFARRRYLASSREIKRLEAVSRSPVYAEFGATLNGLTTLRAYGAEAATHKGFLRLLEENSKGWYCFILVSRWLGFRLDLETAAFLMCTTLVAAAFKGIADPGLVAFALLYTLSLSGQFQWAVRESAEAENYMTAFERMLHYTRLPSEHDSGVTADKEWPHSGTLQVQDLSVRYREDLPVVLKSVSFTVPAGSKVGICGRTGSGKSSLVMAMLRLNQIINGDIKLDGVSLLQLGLSEARQHISWIPQDPHLFSGTLRFNLDPFQKFTDVDLWESLRSVQLTRLAENHPDGLSMEVAEGGGNLSVGQRQLVSLARAALNRNPVIFLDEATASVDYETDALIQIALRTAEAFKKCTVITIAHRIQSVIDSDVIMVLSDGSLVESGPPWQLVDDPASHFSRMLSDTSNSEALKQQARDAKTTKVQALAAAAATSSSDIAIA